MELRGLEPLTPCMPCRCATSCATAPIDAFARSGSVSLTDRRRQRHDVRPAGSRARRPAPSAGSGAALCSSSRQPAGGTGPLLEHRPAAVGQPGDRRPVSIGSRSSVPIAARTVPPWVTTTTVAPARRSVPAASRTARHSPVGDLRARLAAAAAGRRRRRAATGRTPRRRRRGSRRGSVPCQRAAVGLAQPASGRLGSPVTAASAAAVSRARARSEDDDARRARARRARAPRARPGPAPTSSRPTSVWPWNRCSAFHAVARAATARGGGAADSSRALRRRPRRVAPAPSSAERPRPHLVGQLDRRGSPSRAARGSRRRAPRRAGRAR